MKVSISLPRPDIEFLDSYAHDQNMPSRSAVVHQAVSLLRASQLGSAYAEAWDSWTAAGEDDLWDAAISDGMDT